MTFQTPEEAIRAARHVIKRLAHHVGVGVGVPADVECWTCATHASEWLAATARWDEMARLDHEAVS